MFYVRTHPLHIWPPVSNDVKHRAVIKIEEKGEDGENQGRITFSKISAQETPVQTVNVRIEKKNQHNNWR